MKCYDRENKRLIYYTEKASPEFWDNQWSKKFNNICSSKKKPGKNSKIVQITKKYLKPSEGPLLEGGCGLSLNVMALVANGYDCIGVDNARRTVQYINSLWPDLKVQFGDVECLKFESSFFSGYWSLGVIEHFWKGFGEIAREMYRVLKPGGYIFISFPCMNLIRKLKAAISLYQMPLRSSEHNFYQFAFSSDAVQKEFHTYGFELVKKYNNNVLYGLTDEFNWLNGMVTFISKHRGRNILTKSLYYVIATSLDHLLGRVFGHSVLLVFRKNQKSAVR